jgi:hypothetical protein
LDLRIDLKNVPLQVFEEKGAVTVTPITRGLEDVHSFLEQLSKPVIHFMWLYTE